MFADNVAFLLKCFSVTPLKKIGKLFFLHARQNLYKRLALEISCEGVRYA